MVFLNTSIKMFLLTTQYDKVWLKTHKIIIKPLLIRWQLFGHCVVTPKNIQFTKVGESIVN